MGAMRGMQSLRLSRGVICFFFFLHGAWQRLEVEVREVTSAMIRVEKLWRENVTWGMLHFHLTWLTYIYMYQN